MLPPDKQLEKAWLQFFDQFDDAVTARIEADQEPDLESRPDMT